MLHKSEIYCLSLPYTRDMHMRMWSDESHPYLWLQETKRDVAPVSGAVRVLSRVDESVVNSPCPQKESHESTVCPQKVPRRHSLEENAYMNIFQEPFKSHTS